MSRYDTVLFDFDGTVVDSTDAVLKAWQHTYDVLRPGEYDEQDCLSTFGEQLDVSMHKHFPEVPTEQAVAIYRDWQIERLDQLVHEIPGVIDAVDRIHCAGYKTGVVTSRHAETADILFDMFDVRKYFDVMLTCEDTEKHKPDPEPIDKALSMLGAEAERSLYIGDAVFDLLTSHNAGVDFGLVLWTKTYHVERIGYFELPCDEEGKYEVFNDPEAYKESLASSYADYIKDSEALNFADYIKDPEASSRTDHVKDPEASSRTDHVKDPEASSCSDDDVKYVAVSDMTDDQPEYFIERPEELIDVL